MKKISLFFCDSVLLLAGCTKDHVQLPEPAPVTVAPVDTTSTDTIPNPLLVYTGNYRFRTIIKDVGFPYFIPEWDTIYYNGTVSLEDSVTYLINYRSNKYLHGRSNPQHPQSFNMYWTSSPYYANGNFSVNGQDTLMYTHFAINLLNSDTDFWISGTKQP